MKLRRTVRINARGKELPKFINLIHENRIECRAQYCRGEVFHGDVFRRELPEIQDIAGKCGVELKTAAYDSLGERLFRYRKRVGLLVGLVLAAFAAIYFSDVIVTIEIYGNTSVSDEVILVALAELDIKPGTPVHSVDLEKCGNRLPFLIDGVAWAGMHRTGSRIYVQIRENAPIPQKVRGRVPCNVVAAHDAEITYILAQSGFAMYRVGDFVPKGALLISGVTQSESGRTSVSHAMGEVRGIYNETVSFSAAFRSSEYNYTGRTDTQRTLRLFNLDIPLFFGSGRFESSTSEYSESPFVLFGKEFPISLRQRTLSETVRSEVVFTPEELKEKLMDKIYLYEKNFLSDTRIIDRSIEASQSDDTMTLSVSYRLEGDICRQQEVFIK
ncbi:sporulation protein YqfD [Ruminococcus sp.]